VGSPIRACLAVARPETGARIRRIAGEIGLTIVRDISPDEVSAIAAMDDVQVLFIEQHGSSEIVAARIYSLAGATSSDLLIVAIVPWPRANTDREILRAGAFDVLDDGPHLEDDVAHTFAAAQRVVELQQERARLNSELAHQEKLSALGVLAAGVSHEINNPCAAILSNINVVRDQLEALMARPRAQRAQSLEVMGSDWIEALGDSIAAANRINAIVKTLNVFSRKGDQAPPVVIDINEDIRTVLRLIGKEVRFRAEFELALQPDIPKISAPPNSITQIVTNLVVNALQALESTTVERPRILLSTVADDEHVMIEVSDNGPGMSGEILSRIFDPFFTTKPVGKGTGLGLAITQQLVRRLGGEILVYSEPGQGARFSVVIERHEELSRAAPELSLPPASDRLRVLLLDDDELILRSLMRSLSPHFECQAVAQARTALDVLTSDGDFDAVVSDVVMPEMNGLEFWTALEHTRPELALKTVFISGGITSEQLRVRVSDTGRPCLTKPVDMPELIRTIRRLGRPFEEFHR
jgi:two-component system, NtrC family, sensor kinase